MSVRTNPTRDEALVIRSIRHGETSRILTLFSRRIGKYAVIAKGSRKGRSAGALGAASPPSRIEALVYFKQTRSVQTLGQTSLINSYSFLKTDLIRTAHASVILQYLNQSFTEHESNEEAFDAAAAALDALNSRDKCDPRFILWMFQLDLIRVSGFEFDPVRCVICGKDRAEASRGAAIIPSAGGISCSGCTHPDNSRIMISGESVSVLRLFSERRDGYNKRVRYSNLRVSPPARREITHALERYFRYHHTPIGNLSSLSILEDLEHPSDGRKNTTR